MNPIGVFITAVCAKRAAGSINFSAGAKPAIRAKRIVTGDGMTGSREVVLRQKPVFFTRAWPYRKNDHARV
jgi:hypothetical protein